MHFFVCKNIPIAPSTSCHGFVSNVSRSRPNMRLLSRVHHAPYTHPTTTGQYHDDRATSTRQHHLSPRVCSKRATLYGFACLSPQPPCIPPVHLNTPRKHPPQQIEHRRLTRSSRIRPRSPSPSVSFLYRDTIDCHQRNRRFAQDSARSNQNSSALYSPRLTRPAPLSKNKPVPTQQTASILLNSNSKPLTLRFSDSTRTHLNASTASRTDSHLSQPRNTYRAHNYPVVAQHHINPNLEQLGSSDGANGHPYEKHAC